MASLGVEYGAVYRLTASDGTTVVWNNSASADYVGALSAESSGLDSADVREDAQDATEADGGVHGSFWYGRRPIILQGTIYPITSATDRNEKIGKLKRASNAMRTDAILQWKPLGAPEEVFLYVRRQQPLRLTKGYVKDFMLPLVAASIYPQGVTTNTKSVTIATQTKFVTKFPTIQTQIQYGGFGEHEGGMFEPGTSGITAEDGVFTSSALTAAPVNQLYLLGTGYNFGIPGTATILGVEAGIKRRGFNGSAGGGDDFKDNLVKLIITGSGGPTGTNKASAENWPELNTWKAYGGQGDLWGTSLTPTIVNKNGANEFGLTLIPERVTYDAGDLAQVDAFVMTIYYKEVSVPSNTVVCENKGDAPASPVVTIKNRVENPVITNSTTGESITLDVQLQEGETLVIDFANHTINRNGVGAYYLLDFPLSTWWTLEPGNNTIAVSGDYGTAAAKMEITWRNTYL
jgi:hypothetical protein